jgi:PEP-CTERM motif
MTRRRITALVLTLAAVTSWTIGGSIATAAGNLYDHTFDGLETAILHGTPVDVDANGGFHNWVAGPDLRASGAILPTPAGIPGAQNGTLAFVPTPGFVYTLTGSFGATTTPTNDQDWVALGFTAGQSATKGTDASRFIGGATAGQPWMIFRGSGATQAPAAFGGPGTGSPVTLGAAPVANGAPVDLRIVLNTTAANWTAEYLAKDPSAPAFTSLGTFNYAANPTIGGVGFAVVSGDVVSSISKFTLHTTGPLLIPGDVTGEGTVDINDFIVIRDNLFDAVTMRTEGDLNADNVVNFADFRLWKSVAPAEVVAMASFDVVPEPAALGMLGAGALALVALRRRMS